MKKTFEFKVDDENYKIINTNPNITREAFIINKQEMKFVTSEFYQYIFSDIDEATEITIIDMSQDGDKDAKRVYKVISEIVDGVMTKMNTQCFSKD